MNNDDAQASKLSVDRTPSSEETSVISVTGDASTQTAKWSDDGFLDDLRQRGDFPADKCFSELKEALKREDFTRLFKMLNANDDPLPEDVPGCLKGFIERATKLPTIDGSPVDLERIERGQRVFMTHALPCAMVLLTKSLPEGYAAPSLSKILCLSDNLSQYPYRRLLGVLQLIVNVCAVGGFEPTGKAIITVPKIRLLHAGIRNIVRRHLPEYEKQYGVPVNFEDMLGTVMGFSHLVVVGLRQLDMGLTDEEAEELYYLWRVFAQMMGIHPRDDANNSDFVPANLSDARLFYDSYRRRHYVEAASNPDGVQLAAANLQMLNDLLPQTPLRRLGLKMVPRIYMEELIGREGCERIGIQPVRFLHLTKWFLTHLPAVWTRLWGVADAIDRSGNVHENLSRVFFQGLINRQYGGEVTFLIPDTLTELRKLAGRTD